MTQQGNSQKIAKRTFAIDADVPTFVVWLGYKTSDVVMQRFPTDNGYFVLEQLLSPWPTTPPIHSITFVELTGKLVCFDDDGQEQPPIDTPWLIRLDIVRLNEKRTKITAECREQAVIGYFEELSAAIARDWSQTDVTGAALPADPTPSAQVERPSGAGDGQAEPSAAKGALVNKPDFQRPLHVFLCHASNDKPAVRALYQRLRAEGIDAWLDEEKLLPGQDWQREIPKAVRASDVVIVCLSRGSINKAGYVQKEIQFALDVADEQPEGAIFLIPAKLEECEVPDRLSRWQWVNYYEEAGWERLMRALAVRSNALGIATVLISGESPRASGYEVKIARCLDWQMTSRRKSFEHDYIG